MFKALLIDLDDSNHVGDHLAISSLASYLRAANYHVDIDFFNFKEVPSDQIVKNILKYEPSLVAFSTYISNIEAINDVSAKLKKLNKTIKIAIGGFLPTFDGKLIMERNHIIDFVIKGEGEITLKELVEKVSNNEDVKDIEGLIYRDGEVVIENDDRPLIEDLDSLPWPCRDILADRVNSGNEMMAATIISSRGCNGVCSFCSCHNFFSRQKGKKWRGRSPISIVDEIEHIVREYNVKNFNILDNSFEDSTDYGVERAEAIANLIIERDLKINFEANFRAETVANNPELIKLLKKAGLKRVLVGIENINESDLKKFNKKATADVNLQCMQILKELNISINMGFIMANPYSTFDTLRNNMNYLKKVGQAHLPIHYLSRLMVFIGTHLHKQMTKEKLFPTEYILNEDFFFQYKYQDPRIELFVSRVIEKLRKYLIIGTEFTDVELIYFELLDMEEKTDYINKLIEKYEADILPLQDRVQTILTEVYDTMLTNAELNIYEHQINWFEVDKELMEISNKVKMFKIGMQIKMSRIKPISILSINRGKKATV